MKILFRTLLFVVLLFTSYVGSAQTSLLPADQVYGLDPLLHNGKYYSFFMPAGTKGSPFLVSPNFVKGSVKIRGINYDHVLLNYDIYNQQLILKYRTRVGKLQLLVISEAWLETFHLGGLNFDMMALQDSIRRIYQVLGTGRKRVLYSWKKSLSLDISYGATNDVFSKPIKETYVLFGSKLMRYKNNKSFVKLFGVENQAILSKHLRRQKINVKKANDQTIGKLIIYCNSLPSK